MINLLLPAVFIPMIFLFIWFKNRKKNNQKSWKLIMLMFIWGSTIAFGLSIILEGLAFYYMSNFLLLIIILAPIIEEISKPLGLRIINAHIKELEDGIIYGAIAGFGFVATENFLYGVIFQNESAIPILSLFYLGIIGRTLLHTSATAFAGYGYSRKIVKYKKISAMLPFIVFSIGIHAFYNILAISELIVIQIFGLIIVVVFTLLLIIWIRRKIKLSHKKSFPKKSALIKIH